MPQTSVTRFRDEDCKPEAIVLIVKAEAWIFNRPPSMIGYGGRIWRHWDCHVMDTGDYEVRLSAPIDVTEPIDLTQPTFPIMPSD